MWEYLGLLALVGVCSLVGLQANHPTSPGQLSAAIGTRDLSAEWFAIAVGPVS